MTERLLHMHNRKQNRVHKAPRNETIGQLQAENMELREQIASIVLQTASLRETLENQRTHH